MGTPDFAVPSLNTIFEAGYNIVGVITAPDKKSGRGRKINYSPVKKYALEKELLLLQPTNLKDEEFIEQLKNLKPEIQVVVAFRMLPEVVWSLPPMGTFNLHASLLPQYRGAAPINHAIMNGEKETGLTTFFLDDKIDTGKIISQYKMEIGFSENFGQLHDRLMAKGADLVLETIELIINGKVEPVLQSILSRYEKQLVTAPKLSKEDCRIDWNDYSLTIYNKIRGLSPYPTAFTYLTDKDNNQTYLKLFSANIEKTKHELVIGELLTNSKNYLKVAVKDGFIEILELQQEGKGRVIIKEFLNGFVVEKGMKFN